MTDICGHIPPRPPINLRPVWPEPEPREPWEIQLASQHRQVQISRGEKIWEITRQIAQGTNVAGGVVWEVPKTVDEPVSDQQSDGLGMIYSDWAKVWKAKQEEAAELPSHAWLVWPQLPNGTWRKLGQSDTADEQPDTATCEVA